jgi:uncharacterized protein
MQYIYTIKLIERLHDPKKWTNDDEQAVNRHFEYLKYQMQQGNMILAGRTQNDLKDTFGIVIFNAKTMMKHSHLWKMIHRFKPV